MPANSALDRLASALAETDAVLVGAGAGLSTSAGFVYSGERFWRHFADFAAKYPFRDMYSGGFHRFESPEEFWAYWSRYVLINRYEPAPKPVYRDLVQMIEGHDHIVLPTNVDHQFQLAGIDHSRLFYTQGDFGLFQCSVPCHQGTYDNEAIIRAMVAEQRDLRVPSELIPHCPVCGEPMSMNLRADDTFVQDVGWYEAAARYREYLETRAAGRLLLLELGIGNNTPGIVRYPFWRLTAANPDVTYATINVAALRVPDEIADRTIAIEGDVGDVLAALA